MQNRFLAYLFTALLICLAAIQCTKKYPAEQKTVQMASSDGCIGCHTNSALLKEVADPLPDVEGDAGEG